MYSVQIKKLINISNHGISNYFRKKSVIKQLLWDETSFLNYDASLSDRMWYVRNDIYEQVKCPVCNKPAKIDLKNNEIKYCSRKCALSVINPKTGLTKSKEIGLKIKESNSKIDIKTGLTKYEENSLKIKKTLFKINPETGLTRAKELSNKAVKKMKKINPETGLTRYQEIGLKIKKSNSKIDSEIGLTGYQRMGIAQSITKSKIDSNTGLTKAKEIGIKSKRGNLRVGIDGLTGYQRMGIAGAKTRNKINPKTGLSINSENGKKTKILLKLKCYNKLLDNFPNTYQLITSKDEYIKQKISLIKYQHECGEVRIAHRQVNIRCLKCYPYNRSIAENEILEFCQSLNNNVISCNRQIISPLELDIYIPNYNLAIEYDGLYYHSYDSVESEDKDYHLIKTKLCKEKGIQLLHIFENEWEDPNKREIWKSIIRNKLGQSKKIFARKCKIQKISSIKTKEFLDKNHLQGNCPSSINIGLYYEDELVSLMTFGKSRYDKKIDWELLRFCNKIGYSVIGGASRLFKNFLKKYRGSVISYADLRRSNGGLYKNLGFEFSHESGPNYWYWYHKKYNGLESRIKYQKHKLKDKLEEFDESLTESENMYNNGYRKIFDCGNQIWIYK